LEQATHLVPERKYDASMNVPSAILINWKKHEYYVRKWRLAIQAVIVYSIEDTDYNHQDIN
jgi:hypothetical protein